MPQISMQSSFAKIEINTTPSVQTIEQPMAKVDLQQPKAEIEIQSSPAQLTIDQTAARESLDIKHIFRRIEEYAQKGSSDLLNGIARTASEGDELMRIENGGSPIASLAKYNSQLFNFDYNIGFVPPPFSVKININPGKLMIQAYPKQVINNTVVQKPIINYQVGDVITSMNKSSELNIDIIKSM